MNLERFKGLVQQVASMDEEPEFFGGASDSAINEVSNALGINLDKQLTAYLKAFGGGGIPDSLHTNGIWNEDEVEDNIYTLHGATLYGRTYYHLPKNYVMISGDFFGKCWVLDCSNPVENPVYYYNCSSERVENKLYNSFEEYLLSEWQAFVDETEEDE